MRFQSKVQKGKLIKRYKRFLADVKNDEDGIFTIHCPNTGSMKNCQDVDAEVWYSTSTNLKRKYPNTWEVLKNSDEHLIGINTNNANKIVVEALEQRRVSEFLEFETLQTEVKYGEENSRIDILLHGLLGSEAGLENETYIEVKSVTLLENDNDDLNTQLKNEEGAGFFPDAVSERGAKHLRELMSIKAAGARAVLFFCVQHTGIKSVRPAAHIDPVYTALLRQAHEKGVEIIAYACRIDEEGIYLHKPLPVKL